MKSLVDMGLLVLAKDDQGNIIMPQKDLCEHEDGKYYHFGQMKKSEEGGEHVHDEEGEGICKTV